MSTLREAAQAALEALELGTHITSGGMKAMAILRAALAEPQQGQVQSSVHQPVHESDDATRPLCRCGVKAASECDEEWGPQCDLGNNPKFVRVYEPQAEPVGWAQLGLMNGKTYLRMVYDRTPYPPPADVVRNLNLVPVFAAPQPDELTALKADIERALADNLALQQENKRLRAQLDVATAGFTHAVNHAQWQAVTNKELNDLHDQISDLRAGRIRRLQDDPEKLEALKRRIKDEPEFGKSLLLAAGIINEDGSLAERFGGAAESGQQTADAPYCPWCDRQGWDTCQHADDTKTCNYGGAA